MNYVARSFRRQPEEKLSISSHASEYSSQFGWHVFPIYGMRDRQCTCGGLPSCKGGANAGKHPIYKGGKNNASVSPKKIEEWFRDHPDANLALNCLISGLVVVDIDPRNGGDVTWKRFQNEKDMYESSVIAVTGGGGEHHYYRAPPGHWEAVAKEHRPGIDIQFNAYVVLPPSRHKSGRPYTWKPGCDPFSQNIDVMGLPPLPELFIATPQQENREPDQATSNDSLQMFPGTAIERLGRLALASISKWAPSLYPDGYWSADNSWRVESSELGRDYEEALSIHPKGIRDHGPELGLTPLQLLRRDFVLDRDGLPERHEVVDWEKESRHPQGMSEQEAISWLSERISFDIDAERMVDAGHWFDDLDVLREGNGDHSAPNDGDPERPGSLRLFFPDELDALPEPVDFVEGVLFEGGLSALYGESNIGKTFISLDIAMHVASGRSWRGLAIDQGAVLYVALEGVGGVRQRFQAWCKYHDVPDPSSLPVAFMTGNLNLRDQKGGRADIVRGAKLLAARSGSHVKLIVVDTLARAMAGGDENSSEDMGALISGADAIREATGAHVSLVHHSGKDGAKGARGHSSLRGAVDTEIEIRREQVGVSSARVTKQKEGETRGTWEFSLHKVDLERTDRRNKPISSAVAVPSALSAFDEPDNNKLTARQRTALSILQELTQARALHIGDEDDGSNDARDRVAAASWEAALRASGWPHSDESGQDADNSGSWARAWRRVREDLKSKGLIVIEDDFVLIVYPSADKARTARGQRI